MGASCTTTVTPKEWRFRASPRHYQSRWSKHRSSLKNGGPGTATSQMLSPSHLVNYDTDDEEMMDLSKVPKFARELIINLQHEEEEIEGEEIDPILLTKIRPGSLRYEFVRENGTKQMFRAESLIDYMLSTRQFQDPETRIEFTEDQLKELDVLGSQLGKPSVYEAKVDGAWLKQKQEDDMDAFNGVEHLCGEYVYKMLRIIEHAKKQNAQEGEVSLLMKCFPFYRHYVSMMFYLDKNATMVAIDQYKIFLQGPPNRPTPDRTKKLLKVCLDYIDEVSKELWKSANIDN